jgi:site-specific DNA-methyltransferase (adenine-specific)/adenine-specific DNA-methyltransferase
MPTLNWIGKEAVVNHHQQVPFRLLKDVPDLACGDPGSGNLIVQGDNLEALKALLPYYAGQVKCIYIDPPYNTGNEGWAYNDNVNSPVIRDWLGKTVGKEGETLDRHDRWLCMMYPRLALLRQFLSEDGAIFISIDDTEQPLLRLLMDEIFGNQNFVASIVWQKRYGPSNDHKAICPIHDYVTVYQKTLAWKRNLLPRTAENDKQYKYTDEKGVFRPDNYTCNKTADERPNLYYPIIHPKTGVEVWPKKTRVWSFSRDAHDENVKNDMVFWGKEGNAKVPSFKRYRDSLRGGGGTVPGTWWTHEFAGHNDYARKELRELELADDFATPKSSLLIERILQIATNPGDMVLDSFAGSGTTGHAVEKMNAVASDKPPRRFILVEMEPNIARTVTAERVRRVALGYTNAKGDAVAGIGGSFRYCELGEPLFDETGMIRETVKFSELARHVYFSETGDPLPRARVLNTPFLGACRGVGIYLLYNGILGDESANGGNVLTRQILAKLPEFDGQKVVYCAGCLLSRDRLQGARITVRQTPYEIKVS